MKVRELKEIIEGVDPDLEVGIAVETPSGYICPDGCLIGVDRVDRGIDWHAFDLVIVPHYRLRLSQKGFEDWVARK